MACCAEYRWLRQIFGGDLVSLLATVTQVVGVLSSYLSPLLRRGTQGEGWGGCFGVSAPDRTMEEWWEGGWCIGTRNR